MPKEVGSLASLYFEGGYPHKAVYDNVFGQKIPPGVALPALFSGLTATV
jgi:hypothetical protein